eukprot:395787-Prymnesium_polylepis.1
MESPRPSAQPSAAAAQQQPAAGGGPEPGLSAPPAKRLMVRVPHDASAQSVQSGQDTHSAL